MTTPASARVLVLEDDAALSDVLRESLEARGHRVTTVGRIADALERLAKEEFDVALLDLHLPDGSGLDVLRWIFQEELPTEAIVLTGYAEVSTALEAVRLGAYDYLTKPAQLEELEVLVARAAEKAALRQENVSLRVRLQRHEVVEGLLTEDPVMKQLVENLERAAPSDLPVVLEGESGTGKELLARALHRHSPRASQAFVAINCGAVPEGLVESELFGHEKGAFTGAVLRKPGLFEVANRGVLFLDEVAELPSAAQVKILRVLETKEVLHLGGTRPTRSDVRVVAASAKSLRKEVEAGRFREDLFYRLNGLTLRIPPLRDRKDDIPLLAAHFIRKLGSEKSLTPGAVQSLKSYPWPGNVRELQMVIQRVVTLSRKNVIDAGELQLDTARNWMSSALKSGMTLAQLEGEYIQTVLDQHHGHRGKAARALGIDPKTLYNKLGPERSRGEGEAED